MSKDSKKMSLTMQIMLAMGIGVPVGILLNQFSGVGWIDTYMVSGLLNVIGAVFIAALKMMVVPLVFVSEQWTMNSARSRTSMNCVGSDGLPGASTSPPRSMRTGQ